jgi:hypothetical protein
MAETTLFQSLKRLFGTGVIVRKIGGKKLKVADTDNVQSYMSNSLRDRYAKVHAGTSFGMGGSYGQNMAYQAQRIMLFRDYDLMDSDPIVASALDIYADESTVKNEYGEILTINSNNSTIKDILHNLFYDILNIEFNLWPWARNLCKYGDLFLFLEISPEYGIHNVLPLSVYDTIRKEGEDVNNPYYYYFETLGQTGHKQKFENFEIAHFRLLSDSNFLPYGKSMVENGRRAFRQLTLMEDAMMIHRIMRAPEKRVFKIDIGQIPPSEVDGYIQKLMDRAKKVPFVDPQTGDYNLRYNMQNLLEDFFLPVRGGDSGTSIENLGGLEYSPIEDIEYLRNKFMAALKIPKAFLGYDESINGKATLAAEDVRFARTIERIQRIIVSELTKIAYVHLYAQGFRDEELISFSLELTNPSTIYEQEKINLWLQKAQLVQTVQGSNLLDEEWLYENVWEMSPEEIVKTRQRMVTDKKYKFRLAQIEAGQSDPAKFGFPQDQEPQELGMGVEDASGGGGGETPSSGESGGGGVTSIDQLPTAQDLGLEEDAGPGQPKKGMVYAQDSHVRGRDPLGFKERYKAMKIGTERRDKPKPSLSLEVNTILSNMSSRVSKKKVLTENVDSDTQTFLDERNILDEQ